MVSTQNTAVVFQKGVEERERERERERYHLSNISV
jgi:hypothetical protein